MAETLTITPYWHGLVLEELPVKKLTPEQERYKVVMERLDVLKFDRTKSLEKNGDIDFLWRKLNPRRIKGLSPVTSEFVNDQKSAVVFAEYEMSDERRLGIRTVTKEVLFTLDKDNKTCTGMALNRQSVNSEWAIKSGLLIPSQDAEILVALF